MATQSNVNEHADWVAAQQAAAKNKKHVLPEPRKKPAPTRKEFEAAENVLALKNAQHEQYLTRFVDKDPRFYAIARAAHKRAVEESREFHIVKRYKALT